MLKLPREIWLIVFGYLREYEYSRDSRIWRVRTVCKDFADLANELIWSQVDINCSLYMPDYGTSSERQFTTLTELVEYCAEHYFAHEGWTALVKIKSNIKGLPASQKRFDAFHNVSFALLILHEYDCESVLSENPLIRAVSRCLTDKAGGVSDMVKALESPFSGYAMPGYYSNAVDIKNISASRDIVSRYSHYIKVVWFSFYDFNDKDTSKGHLELFTEALSGIARSARLQQVNAALRCSETTLSSTAATQTLKLFAKRQPPIRDLSITLGFGTLTHNGDIIKAINSFSRDTQLGLWAGFETSGNPLPTINPSLVYLTTRGELEIPRLHELLLSTQDCLTRLCLYHHQVQSEIHLPGSITDLEVSHSNDRPGVKGGTIMSSHTKSLKVNDIRVFEKIKFDCPQVSHLKVKGILSAGFYPIEGHLHSPFPLLQVLDCELVPVNDALHFIEFYRPSQKLVLAKLQWQSYGNFPGSGFGFIASKLNELYRSQWLPSTITLELGVKMEPASHLYFMQKLLTRPSISQLQLMQSSVNNSPRFQKTMIDDIPARYKRLCNSTTLHAYNESVEVYVLDRDLVNFAITERVEEALKALLD
ncbi:hypothetical protein TRVA0_055S00364 [Trichomonascus vanleenenianus]|uniref:F-box protein n=1 Tax=Trichomonascus vanleenenianus TaxID=2268995 RepID=UPI003ECB291B